MAKRRTVKTKAYTFRADITHSRQIDQMVTATGWSENLTIGFLVATAVNAMNMGDDEFSLNLAQRRKVYNFAEQRHALKIKQQLELKQLNQSAPR